MRFVSYLVRPSVFLVLGLAAGYWFGYSDAFRDTDTIGARVTRAIGKVDPEQVRAEKERRAEVLRDTIRMRAGAIVP